jgi:hypothetical protein
LENCDQNALENDNDDDKKGHKNVLFGGLYFFLLVKNRWELKKTAMELVSSVIEFFNNK